MLKEHPHGDTFREIRDLARYVGDYVPPISDPEEEKQTREQKILYSILNFILSAIELAVITGWSEGGVRGKSANRKEKLPKYYEQLNQKLSELMDVLDCSKDSTWLATYMIEDGSPSCPLAVSAFQNYLERCYDKYYR